MLRPALTTAALAVLVLSGCAGLTPIPGAPPDGTSAPRPSETLPAGPAEATPVDPAQYATQLTFVGEGVDFDSADHNIHCGIFLGWETSDGPTPTAVCRATNATYKVDPPTDPSGNVNYDGGRLFLDGPAGPNMNSGAVTAGESPTAPVGVLDPGFSISFGDFTCTSPDEDSIECIRNSDGAGFMVGGTSYRYF